MPMSAVAQRLHVLADTKAGAFRAMKSKINSEWYGVKQKRGGQYRL